MKKSAEAIIGALITGILFIAEIILLKVYDVAPIGAGGTYIGFSGINGKVHEFLGVHLAWYKITEYIGYAMLAICLCFAIMGLRQLIRRRSLFKVDGEILALGGLFLADIAFYLLFEKLVINYRPILMDGSTEPEASFPSSHTVLVLCVMMAIFIIADHYVGKTAASLIRIFCVVVSVVTVLGRLYSGAHWLTDIIGGVLLSATLLFIFDYVVITGEYDAESFYEEDEDFYGEEVDDEDEEEADEEYDEEEEYEEEYDEDGEYYDEEYDEDEEYYEDEDDGEYYEDDGEYYEDEEYEDDGYEEDDGYIEQDRRGSIYKNIEKAEVDYSKRYFDFQTADESAVSLADLFDEEEEDEDPGYGAGSYEAEENEPISYVPAHSEPEMTDAEFDDYETSEFDFDGQERSGSHRRAVYSEKPEGYEPRH